MDDYQMPTRREIVTVLIRFIECVALISVAVYAALKLIYGVAI